MDKKAGSSSSSDRRVTRVGGKKKRPARCFKYSYYIFSVCGSCHRGKKYKPSTPLGEGRGFTVKISGGGSDVFRGGPRRMARFDWVIEPPPRPLARSSQAGVWLLLHCLWWEHNIALEAESELGACRRNPWKSCWSSEGFVEAWTELTGELEVEVALPTPGCAAEDRALRLMLTDEVTKGLFKPPFEHRFQGSNFKWLSNAFEAYQDFCVGRQLLWGVSKVPR